MSPSQLLPVNWGAQMQLNVFPTGTHWPPLLHGFGLQMFVARMTAIFVMVVN